MTKWYTSLADRFADKHMPEPNSGCWLWLGALHQYGYGIIDQDRQRKRLVLRAHRVSYELHKGPIPKGMLVCHSCDTPPCVNPDHLFVGTYNDNNQDKIVKGRARHYGGYKGVDHGVAILTEVDVLAIRASRGKTLKELGLQYGVHLSQISNIRRGKNWKHLP